MDAFRIVWLTKLETVQAKLEAAIPKLALVRINTGASFFRLFKDDAFELRNLGPPAHPFCHEHRAGEEQERACGIRGTPCGSTTTAAVTARLPATTATLIRNAGSPRTAHAGSPSRTAHAGRPSRTAHAASSGRTTRTTRTATATIAHALDFAGRAASIAGDHIRVVARLAGIDIAIAAWIDGPIFVATHIVFGAVDTVAIGWPVFSVNI